MPGVASATGLLSARVHPVYRVKPKLVELSGHGKQAPFVLKPYAGLFNPFSYGCSVLCNHPVDNEAKEVLRKAKEQWVYEKKTLLLPEEMEMIRVRLMKDIGVEALNTATDTKDLNTEAVSVPEELFRKYTETDSRAPTPTPTLVSVSGSPSCRALQEVSSTTSYNFHQRERTTLVLDLRADTQTHVNNETFTWHALTLEALPPHRKTGIICKPVVRCKQPSRRIQPPAPCISIEATGLCETNSSSITEEGVTNNKNEAVIPRRRGKKLRKRKCRRNSISGQQSEVRDPLEPLQTQVSQIRDTSRRSSIHLSEATDANTQAAITEQTVRPAVEQAMSSSFIPPEILKHLCRELNREKVEAEFSTKRKIALEEALRVKGETHFVLRGSSHEAFTTPAPQVPRVFSRQAARFEILDSQSLQGISPLEYLSKYVFITSARKLIFARIFNKFHEESLQGMRYIPPTNIYEALKNGIGDKLDTEQLQRLNTFIGNISEPLNFRTWCGLCAATERLVCPLPPRQFDPPLWLEQVDFEGLERRLDSNNVDPRLVLLLREIRDR